MIGTVRLSAVVAALLTVSAATSAVAQPRFYLDYERARFVADAGAVASYGFEVAEGFGTAPAAASSLDGGRIRLSTPGHASSAGIASYGSGQALSGFGDPTRAFVLEFTRPDVFAVGFDNLDLEVQPLPYPAPAEFARIFISFFGSAAPVEYFVNNTTGRFPVTVFFGMLSDAPIASVRISSSPAPGSPVATPHYIDNLVVGSAVVPEPGTTALLAVGLAALLREARARNRVRRDP